MGSRVDLGSVFRRRSATPVGSPVDDSDLHDADGTLDGHSLVLEILGRQGARKVLLVNGGERVTDLVNRLETLSVRPILRLEGEPEPRPEELELAEALILLPPAQPGDRRHRLHRPGRPVRVVVGPYEVVGDVHVPPGTQAVGFLLRSWPRFVPLTRATVRNIEEPEPDRHPPVAIVNLARASLLREVTPGIP